MHGSDRLLLHRLNWDNPPLRPRHRFTDRLGGIALILLLGPRRFDELPGDQPYVLPQLLSLPPPVMRTPTRFPPDSTHRKLGKEGQPFAAAQLLAHPHFVVGISAVDLKHTLGDGKPNSGHWPGPLPLRVCQ
jgi:hypothetical protein